MNFKYKVEFFKYEIKILLLEKKNPFMLAGIVFTFCICLVEIILIWLILLIAYLTDTLELLVIKVTNIIFNFSWNVGKEWMVVSSWNNLGLFKRCRY